MQTLNDWSKARFSWLLLMLGAFGAVAFAYYEQLQGIQPCYYCIYDRYYLTWIGLVAFIAFINPRVLLLRLVGVLGFLLAAGYGVFNGYTHLNYLAESKTNAFVTCPMIMDFLVPFNKVLPSIYTPQVPCTDGGPEFFGINFVQLTMLLFIFLSVLAVLILFAQLPFFNKRNHGLNKSKMFRK